MTWLKWTAVGVLAFALAIGIGMVVDRAWVRAEVTQAKNAAKSSVDSALAESDSIRDRSRVLLANAERQRELDLTRIAQAEQARTAAYARESAAAKHVAAAEIALTAATTAADSLPLYRDILVPALRTSVAELTTSLALADSVSDSWQHGFSQQVAVITHMQGVIEDQDQTAAALRKLVADAIRPEPKESKLLGLIPKPSRPVVFLAGAVTALVFSRR